MSAIRLLRPLLLCCAAGSLLLAACDDATGPGADGPDLGGEPPFDLRQTTFTLSILSNIGQCSTGTVAELEQAVASALPGRLADVEQHIGSWSVVWGPGIVSLPTSRKPDNAIYVARNDAGGTPVLTVSIAGTNPYSVLDWIVEDGLVGSQVDWASDGAPAGRKISLGTSIGLTSLLSLKPGAGITGAGTTLAEFLSTVTGDPVEVRFAGHSLGGALAPTLALWLSDSREVWDPAGNARISVMPSAGPTAGNAAFASYYDRQLGSVTTRLHNAIDVVPHGWAASELEEVPSLYEPQIPSSLLAIGLADLAEFVSRNGDYAQILPGAQGLPGQVRTSVIDGSASHFRNFMVQLGYQHVDEYFHLLEVTEIADAVKCVKESANFETDMEELIARLEAAGRRQ